ncbi:Eukaryotic translation initiation factor 2A [Ceratobasidium theobromae]|uniref:Eukaryotic translation initiation factor 2A n=1 Tax=Ceratobasidium theobromae TaxID=1582974 RepID=A0A5N5QTX1_9AGAM|nr:Eukaryotic translation initiation factor 2A [Ceratobasidium theobromae]
MAFYDDREYSYSRNYSSKAHRAGLALIGAAGLSSAISTLVLLSYIGWYGIFCRDKDLPIVRGIRSFLRSALGVFLVCLLLSDLLQGAAFIINFKWAVDGSAISQVGDSGAAIWSLAIASHTFSLLFLLKKPPVWVTYMVLIIGWTIIIVLPIVGPYVIEDVERSGSFYGLSGAWCWLGDGYQLERFIYLYVSDLKRSRSIVKLTLLHPIQMWIFASLISSIVMYGLVYLRFSGRVTFENGKIMWKKQRNGWGLGCISSTAMRESSLNVPDDSGSNGTRPPNGAEINGVGKHLKTIARRLMLYPLVYSVVTVPVAVCRLGVMAGWRPPFGLYVFAGITFSSSAYRYRAGLTNVLLFIATRHSFIQKVATIRPRVHVTTHQVTVLEDARGAQTIHLHDLSSNTRPEDLDGISEKDAMDVEGEDLSIKSKHRSPCLESEVNSPVSAGIRFLAKQ